MFPQRTSSNSDLNHVGFFELSSRKKNLYFTLVPSFWFWGLIYLVLVLGTELFGFGSVGAFDGGSSALLGLTQDHFLTLCDV